MFLLLKRRFAPKFVQNHGSAVQKVFFRLTCAAQKRGSRLKVLLKITTENGIYSHPMKVISNTILFFYSLRGALIKIACGCYTWWRNYFDGTTPLTAISTPWGRGWEVHQPTAWPVPNHPGASLLGIIKIWNISKCTATNQSAPTSSPGLFPQKIAVWPMNRGLWLLE